jgi:predicted ATP-grasp superfamily ATP-dependent carboligase
MGRVGVPVYAITEGDRTPAATSRYLTERFVRPTTGHEAETKLVEMLAEVGRRIGRPTVVIQSDDEAAVLIAERSHELSEWFIVPGIEPSLPRRLASKRGLMELCVEHGVATPHATFPASSAEVVAFAHDATFPLVTKGVDPWKRLNAPSAREPKIFRNARELELAAAGWGDTPNVMLQEYLPREHSQDWIFQGYFSSDSECLVGFTGVKYRSWPTAGGPTSYGRAVENEPLHHEATRFCRAIRYRGVLDMDWRLDRRSGRYHLLDCNPRMGAQFRLFENNAGIDVVRALHLDLTGRKVPAAPMRAGRGLVVENLDVRAVLSHRRLQPESGAPTHPRGRLEPAWFAWDDPMPFFTMAAMSARTVTSRCRRRAHGD